MEKGGQQVWIFHTSEISPKHVQNQLISFKSVKKKKKKKKKKNTLNLESFLMNKRIPLRYIVLVYTRSAISRQNSFNVSDDSC
ncbi:hypothetical protein Hanom_Chr00s000001g01592771 [Helianthus anomalus]